VTSAPSSGRLDPAAQFGLILIGCCVFVAFCALMQPASPTGPDIAVFRATGEAMWKGRPLYDWVLKTQKDVSIYLYPPVFACFWAPLSQLPPLPAFLLWATAVAVIGVHGVWRLFGALCGPGLRRLQALGLSLALVAPVWLLDITGNGANVLITGLVAHALAALRYKRYRRVGVWLSLAVNIKFLPVVLIPLLLLRRQWCGAALYATVGIFAWNLLVLPFAVVANGLNGILWPIIHMADYLTSLVLPHFLSLDSSVVGVAGGANWSLPDTARRLVSVFMNGNRSVGVNVGWIGFALAASLYGLGAAGAWRHRRAPMPAVAAWGACLMAAVLGNVSTLAHHVAPILLCCAPEAAKPTRSRIYGLGIALYGGVYAMYLGWLTDPSGRSLLATLNWFGCATFVLVVLLVSVAVGLLRQPCEIESSEKNESGPAGIRPG
jgi:hypothetical protein